MERYGKELHFIARIKGDGSGIEPVTSEHQKDWNSDKERYTLNCLSLTNKTWIASGMGTYVVKLKCDVE